MLVRQRSDRRNLDKNETVKKFDQKVKRTKQKAVETAMQMGMLLIN